MTKSPSITITNTTPWHLREMAEAMQADSAETAVKMGMTPLKALWSSYRQSVICKSAFIDGKLAAIWGISGNMLSEVGKPWLVLTPETQNYPMRVAFRYKQEINKMLEMFPVLEEWVPEDNEKSIRMLELMGFKVSKNTVKIGREVFRKAERKA